MPPANYPSVLVEAPAITPYQYGLFSVAAMPQQPSNDMWEQGGVHYSTYACAEATTWDDDCESPPDKPVQGAISVVHGDSFVVLAGPQCDLIGSNLSEIEESAREGLRLGEQRAVEARFWGQMATCTGGAEESPGESPGDPNTCCHDGRPCCVVLNTVGGAEGALSITGGVAALEGYAADLYGGVPVLHSPRELGAFARQANLIEHGGQSKQTAMGSRWAFYGGSDNTGPDATPAPVGTAWLYITGAVTVRRSEVFMTPPDPVDGFNARLNEATIYAERIYALTYECVCAAVLVRVDCAC